MENKVYIGTIAAIICSLVCSCSNSSMTEVQQSINVQWSNDSVIIASESANQQAISISVLDENIYSDSSFQGTWKEDILSLVKKNIKDKLDIALYATKNEYQVPVRIKVDEVVDTFFVLKLFPLKEISSISSIRGNCAPLVASSSNPDYVTGVKRWLFRKNEHLSDSLLNDMVGIVRELNRTNYCDYINDYPQPADRFLL